jgi:hypothetical protein
MVRQAFEPFQEDTQLTSSLYAEQAGQTARRYRQAE